MRDTMLTLAKGAGAITGMETVEELSQQIPETNIMIGPISLKEVLQLGMFILTAVKLFKNPKNKDKKPKKLYGEQ